MDDVKAVVYDGSSVTSPKNWNNPHFGDPCYSLHTDSRNYVFIEIDQQGGKGNQMNGVNCLNPWDVQSKHIVSTDGSSESLCAGEKRWGSLPPNICYALKGNFIDRETRQNGIGWHEGVEFTLDATDRHGVCYEVQADDVIAYDGYNMSVNDKTFMTITSGATDDHHVPSVIYSLEGNGSRPSHQGTGYSDEGKMFTLNTIEKHAVCYDARGNMHGDGGITPTMTGDHESRITDYTSIVVIDHSRRHNYQPLDIFPTMEAHMDTGGGNVPLVLIRE